MTILMILPIAFLADLVFGDPRNFPHPVRAIGNIITFCEGFLRRGLQKTKKGERAGGGILVVIILSASFFIPLALLFIAYKISFILGFVIEIVFCYQILAIKSMKDEAAEVYNKLKINDLAKARASLSQIVGRDTANLDEKGVVKATVETISENSCDGVIAPLFFMVIGGAPLGFLYKAVNTLDSMIGYKNEKYINFGYFAAKLDDILNFIPARITGIFYIISAYLLGYDGKLAQKIYFRDRLKHPSPNSAHGEAAAAGALNIALGGGSHYSGKFVDKDVIGDDIRPPIPFDIIKTIRMHYLVGFLGLITFCATRFVIIFMVNI